MSQLSKLKLRVLVSIVVSCLLITSVAPLETSAVSASQWQASNIIDDDLFYNSSDMTDRDIQTFLNSKEASCRAGYTCLKSYIENPETHVNNSGDLTASIPGGWGSAYIIKRAADTYGLSARSILVLIEKEQGLVTSVQPNAVQYRSATGYGCPDTAACNTDYYGFYNQVMNAARQFKIYANSPSSFRYKPYQTNSIYYNPDFGCGSTSVYIENKATAGLYNYTPYQPNQAALNNLYGTGNDCSAYGNRNFWRLFNDWFGSTKYVLGAKSSTSSTYANSPCTIPAYQPDLVGRLYQPDIKDYLFTTNRQEACDSIKSGYIWDGIAFQNDDGKPNQTPIYRIRVGNIHSYTASLNERNTLLSYGYINEGIVFYGKSTSTQQTLPVYQLSLGKGNTSSRFMTAAGNEGTYFVASLGYESKGIGFYTSSITESSPLYRLRKDNDRFYTTSIQESLSAIQSYGYSNEGTALNADTQPGQYSKPVYRLNGPGGRLYTNDRNERDLAIINFDYNSEGIGFYSYAQNLNGTSPIYRSTNYSLKTRLFTPFIGEYYDSQTRFGYTNEGVSWYGL